MWRLVPALAAEMGEAYPELVRAQPLITETLKLEEDAFPRDADARAKLLDEATASLQKGDTLLRRDGVQALRHLRLPPRSDAGRARARGIDVDTDGFNAAMARQKAEARRAWSGSGEASTDMLWFELSARNSAPPNSSAIPPKARKG